MASEAVPVSSDAHPVNTDPIRISNGSFEWAKKDDAPAPATDENAEKPMAFIHGMNMSIKKGSFTAIVGPVGCGKSSLFSAILGEMNCVSGKVSHIYQQPGQQLTLVPGRCKRLHRLLSPATMDRVLHRPREYYLRQTHGYSAS